MRSALIFLAVVVVSAGITWLVVSKTKADAPQQVKAVTEDPVARGKYLVTILACADCHSPHDMQGPIKGREFSGHPENAPLPTWEPAMMQKGVLVTMPPTLTAFAGPFGVIVAPNITPDEETGMGVLTAEGLIKSWRTGTHWKYPRPILPPMPAAAYKEMKDDDIRAVYAYLRTVPPVKNKTPESVINMPTAPAGNAAPKPEAAIPPATPAPAGAH